MKNSQEAAPRGSWNTSEIIVFHRKLKWLHEQGRVREREGGKERSDIQSRKLEIYASPFYNCLHRSVKLCDILLRTIKEWLCVLLLDASSILVETIHWLYIVAQNQISYSKEKFTLPCTTIAKCLSLPESISILNIILLIQSSEIRIPGGGGFHRHHFFIAYIHYIPILISN